MPDAPAALPPRSVPGLYLAAGSALGGAAALWAGGRGLLYGRATRDGHTLHFEGILTRRAPGASSDAERALSVWLAGGPAWLARLEGYFTVLVVDEAERRAFLMGDAFASRPWYLYRRGRACAAAPTPLFFAEAGLPMRLDRQGLYETVRLLHTAAGAGTLVEEVARIEPGVGYWIEADGWVRRERVRAFVQDEDPSLNLDAAADWLTEIVRDGVRGTLSHPALRDRPVHLALTAGLDSRHVLGELLVQGHPPERLRHVLVTEAEARPVRAMAEGLGLPLDLRSVEALDYDALLARWIERSGGLLHVHQVYLLDLARRLPDAGVVGFDGFLMDLLLGFTQHRAAAARRREVPEALLGLSYTDPAMLRALVPGSARHAEAARAALRAAVGAIEGSAAFTLTLLQALNRGLTYSGGAYPLLGDEALYVAPASTPRRSGSSSARRSGSWGTGGRGSTRSGGTSPRWPPTPARRGFPTPSRSRSRKAAPRLPPTFATSAARSSAVAGPIRPRRPSTPGSGGSRRGTGCTPASPQRAASPPTATCAGRRCARAGGSTGWATTGRGR